MLFRQHPSDIDKLTANINELTVIVRTMAIEHKTLSDDQNVLFKKVDKNGEEIRSLQNTGARIDTVSNLAKWGGIALIGAIFGSWNSLSTRVDNTTAKTEANSQTIIQLKIDSEDTQKQLADMEKRITENRETIIMQLNAKQDKKYE